MQLENLLYAVQDGVGVVTLNRPKALNALDSRTLEELSQVIEAARTDASLRALVITGAGDKAFVAGADISQMAGLSPLEARRFADLGHHTLAGLEALDVPTVAAVNGFALGGGCELALACDLVYASEKARFGQPEVNLGLIPGFGGTQRLARRIGPMRAMAMILTGDMVDAARAREMGLVLEVLPAEKLMEHVMGVARKIAGKGAVCVAQAKRAVLAASDADLETGSQLERQAFAVLFGTEDAREGMKAFLEKRPARFQGR
ncbi:MAG TPA: enoyl-CoA hydratase-related protein [Anaeromyxobacteraceae bacterium]|nr:enoyl-CoA hydratase-related protein [Anaeromyxobacteraceae bacterium]